MLPLRGSPTAAFSEPLGLCRLPSLACLLGLLPSIFLISLFLDDLSKRKKKENDIFSSPSINKEMCLNLPDVIESSLRKALATSVRSFLSPEL